MSARSWIVLMSGDAQILAIATSEEECLRTFYATFRGSLEDPNQAGQYSVFRERWEHLTYFTTVVEVQEVGA